MKPPYYFTEDDRTIRAYVVYTCESLEDLSKRTKIKTFRYTKETAYEVNKKTWGFIEDCIQKSGGSYYYKAWLETVKEKY